MKRIIFNLWIPLIALGMSSCLFQDDFDKELSIGQSTGETKVFFGKPDSIAYRYVTTQNGLESSVATLKDKLVLNQLLSAQYALRGGKNGDYPGPHAYQFQFSLQIDNYAGYFTAPQNFSGRLPDTYFDSEDFNGGAMGSFAQAKNFLTPVLNHPQIDSIPEIKAVTLLLFNFGSQEVADIYGPFPYVDYKMNKQEHPFAYNDLETIYGTIVSNIDSITACFRYFELKPDYYKKVVNELLAEYDKISPDPNAGNFGYWLRFANSLKLRMAMNLVKKRPDLAKKWAEEAVENGVIESPEQQFMLKSALVGEHPLRTISELWNDTRLNASFEAIMKAYKHPALEFLFTKNSENIYAKEGTVCKKDSMIVGIRAGLTMMAGQSYDANFRVAYSKLSEAISQMNNFVMKLSEVHFLRAEAALRGWNMGGSAADFYSKGIRYAYSGTNIWKPNEDWSAEIFFDKEFVDKYLDAYMAIEKAADVIYQDPADPANNAPCMLKVGVKWDETDDNETKLEKIITQKWIAGFPYSFGAWTDLRRTGYPRIFPVARGDGSITDGLIRRIPYNDKEDLDKKDIQSTAIPALGGPDLQGTRLWWDVEAPNF